MALGRIVYDPGGGSRNIDLPEELTRYEERRVVKRALNRSEGGVVLVQFQHFFDEVEIEIRRMQHNVAFMDAIEAFWAWAGKGGTFAFADDSANMILTTLDGAAAANQAVVPVTATTGFGIGKLVTLESANDGWQRERAEMLSVLGGVSFTAVSNLVHAYKVGDIVRSNRYFPKCVCLNDRTPVQELMGTVDNFQMRFQTHYDIQVQ